MVHQVVPYFMDYCTPRMYTFRARGTILHKNKLLKVGFPIPSQNVLIMHIEKISQNVDTPLIHLIRISFRSSHIDDNIITKRTSVP